MSKVIKEALKSAALERSAEMSKKKKLKARKRAADVYAERQLLKDAGICESDLE